MGSCIISKYVIIYAVGIIFTFLSTFVGYYLFGKSKYVSQLSERISFLLLVSVSASVYAVVFSVMKDLTVLSHHSYFDFAVFLDYFNNIAKGNGLFSRMQENAIPGTGNWLSTHFTPAAYIFGFLYKIWPSFHTVNWAQTILLAVSSVILYLLAKTKIGAFSSMCISLAFLFNPTFQYITLYEFEYLRFIIPVGILAVGILLSTDSNLKILLACLIVILMREDAAFFVLGMGFYVFAFRKRRILGTFVMISSMVYIISVLKIIMPSFSGTENYVYVATSSFNEFGTNFMETIKNLLLHPSRLIVHLLHPYKSINYVMYLLPFAFIPLFGIKVLLIAVPTAAMLAFSSSYTHSSYFLYYVSPVLVGVTWATAMGIPNFIKLIKGKSLLKYILRIKGPITKDRISFAVLCGSIACSIYFGPSVFSIQFWNKDFSLAPFRTTTFNVVRYQPNMHDDLIRKIARLIPLNAAVSAEQILLQDIYRCKSVYVFPNIEKADYIFIDKKNPRKAYISGNPQDHYDLVEKRLDIFELVSSEDSIFLYKRKIDEIQSSRTFAPHGN